jgi:hypothetical protein
MGCGKEKKFLINKNNLRSFLNKLITANHNNVNKINSDIKITFFDFDAFGPEEVPQAVDLLLQLADQLPVRVLVHHGLADDLFGAIRVPTNIHKIESTQSKSVITNSSGSAIFVRYNQVV